jgi:hypothetical protein
MPVEDPAFKVPQRPSGSGAAKGIVQERDIVRILILFGGHLLPEGVTVGQYILSDIEDSLSSFDEPIYSRIAQECHQLLARGGSFDANYFIRHDASDVRNLAIDLMTAPWEYSTNWEDKVGLPLQNQPKPDLNFEADMQYAIDMFKFNKLRKMCDTVNPARIKQAMESNDYELLTYYLSVQMKIKDALTHIAQKRNIVVIPT